MNSARSETSLDDLKATALAQNHVALVDADIFEGQVTMTMGGIVETHHRKHTVDGDARSICGNQDDRLLLVCV